MNKSIYRLFSFLGKEFNDVRRQPRLWLSLLLGPLVILALFGIGYQGQRRPPRTVLVIPTDLQNDPRLDPIRGLINQNAKLVEITTDEESALSRLRSGVIDVVEVVPPNFEEKVRSGEQVTLRITYNAIDPQNEQFMEYLGHTHVTALNDALLIQSVADVQQQTSDVQQHVKSAQSTLTQLDSGLSGVNPDQARQSLSLLSTALQALYTQPTLSAARSGTDLARTRVQMIDLHDNLVTLQNALDSGSLANQQQRIVDTQTQLDNLDNRLQHLQGLSPQVIVSPLRQENVNLQGKAFSYMVYFAPGVAVLILQHIAVTLASLSLVRERNDNALEFFSVSPTSMLEVLTGKYFAYLFFLSLISAGLIALLVFALGVPFKGRLAVFAGFMLLFLVAALGLGFFISVLSESETQAVQLAMLSLLLTVFFSGFVLPLDQFQNAVKYVGYVVPMTHAMPGLQAIMLEGHPPGLTVWVGLGLIGLLSFGVVSIIWHRQGRWLH